MRFLHLSDLHIGKVVKEFSMIEDQKYIFSQILKIVEKESIQGIFIAGDIYDKTMPTVESVELFDYFLTMLSKKDIPIFIISGNHDNVSRISFGAELMKNNNVYIFKAFNGSLVPIKIEDEYGVIEIYGIPYIKPAEARPFFPDIKIENTNDAISAIIDNTDLNSNNRKIILAHQFVTGAVVTGHEDISVGGVDSIDYHLFDKFDYVALGHIHSSQKIGRDEVRYCGTPLKYSFSEIPDEKSVTMVEIDEEVKVSVIKLSPKRDIKKIKGSYEEITSLSFYQNFNLEDYFFVVLTDEEDIPDAMAKLRTIYKNIMTLQYDNTRTKNNQSFTNADSSVEKTPLQLFNSFYEMQNNCYMNEEQEKIIKQIIDEIWGEH
ncbi:MAG: exonuclease SbcCD subunit D [Oscillospiraceae bacterium]